jgi:hypothetical protein
MGRIIMDAISFIALFVVLCHLNTVYHAPLYVDLMIAAVAVVWGIHGFLTGSDMAERSE